MGMSAARAVVSPPALMLTPEKPVASMLARDRQDRIASETVLWVAPCHGCPTGKDERPCPDRRVKRRPQAVQVERGCLDLEHMGLGRSLAMWIQALTRAGML